MKIPVIKSVSDPAPASPPPVPSIPQPSRFDRAPEKKRKVGRPRLHPEVSRDSWRVGILVPALEALLKEAKRPFEAEPIFCGIRFSYLVCEKLVVIIQPHQTSPKDRNLVRRKSQLLCDTLVSNGLPWKVFQEGTDPKIMFNGICDELWVGPQPMPSLIQEMRKMEKPYHG